MAKTTEVADAAVGKGRPNILMVVVDCLRADRCPTVAGNDRLKFWPRLRDEGTCFSQMISSASTTPVCFGSIFTGQYPFVHGLKNMRGCSMAKSLPTLPELLKQAGYNTYAFVTGPMIHPYGLDRGFDEYDHRTSKTTIYSEQGQAVLNRCGSRELKEPWFSIYHLFEIHRPHQLNNAKDPGSRVGRYDLALQLLDEQLAGLYDSVPENTIIILTADHGEAIIRRADRSRWGHFHRRLRGYLKLPRRPVDWKSHGFFLYEELLRIPLVVCGPGIAKGKVVHEQVRQVDIMPTIMELAQVENRLSMHGETLGPLMRGEEMEPRSAYIMTGWTEKQDGRNWHGLRQEKWKYIERPRQGPHVETSPMLFDLENDPDEERNVLHKYPEKTIEMRLELDRIVYSSQAEAGPDDEGLSEEENAVVEEQLKALGYL